MTTPKLNLQHAAAALSVAALVATSCGGPDGPMEVTPNAPGRVHLLLTDQARAEVEALNPPTERGERATAKTLTYYGGPVIQSVHVVPVYWNSKVQYQSNLNAFYKAVSTGQFMTFLSQYSTASPKQTIGNGSAVAGVVDTQTSTSITDTQIQTYLANAFNSGKLPKPNANNLYMIHFPAGVSITDGTSKSCVQFCAYHGTGTYGGQDFFYGVLPDLGQSGCAGGCGASTVLNNSTSVASHEFAEAVTDPAVGLATVYAAPLAWYNKTYGEVGDICNGQQTTTTLSDGKSYTVQKEWSNKSSTCAVP